MPAKKKEQAQKLQITLIKSKAGCLEKQIKTLEALGLGKINSTAVHNDNDAIRGMIFVVKHLVSVTPVAG
ncbi:MAG: 50S ribosomal protein L30 [Firmicutes bacterium]|nr:50S ribosomal protein L30 [Bacillota bacterium]